MDRHLTAAASLQIGFSVLVLILSAIDLLNIPIGTALGIYTIWVLVQAETVVLFEKDS